MYASNSASEGWRSGVTTFISPDRAKQVIRDGNTSFGDYQKYLRKDEIAEVKRLWKLNPNGSSSFFSTLRRIGEGHFEYDREGDHYRSLKYEIKMDDIKYDPFGTAMAWLFAICDELHFNAGAEPPAEWEYRPSIIATGPDEGSSQAEAVKDGDPNALVRLGNLLHRYLARVKRAGRDY